MKRFFQKMAEFLKHGAALIAGGFYIWAIIILLNNDNWIGISTLTTMLLAIAAFWAIWQNHNLQKRERRDRLLNEIIEWAERILLYGAGETVREGWAQLSDEQKTEKSFAMRKGLGFMDIRDKGISIIYMSSYIDTDLKTCADTTMKLLQEHIDKWTQVKSGEIKDWSTIAAYKSELDKSARQLIKKAAALLCKLSGIVYSGSHYICYVR